MKLRLLLPLSLLLVLAPFAVAIAQSGDLGARNKDGSIVTGVLTARFDPDLGLEGVPIPNNLFYLGTTDLTVNVDTEGLEPAVAGLVEQLNSLDGFSTSGRWVTRFVDDDGNPASIDEDSVVAGQSVRVFQVNTQGLVAVTEIVRELAPEAEYTVGLAEGGILAIVPLQPLAEYTAYMAVLTNDIKDSNGNDATPDQTYFLSKRRDPWVDASGSSTYPLIDDATAQSLEQLRQITQSMELNAATRGIDPDDIVLAWTVQTQSITPTLGTLRATLQPQDVTLLGPVGNTADFGLQGLADIYIGIISVPYYLGIPSAENPTAPLTEFWKGAPGAYVPPFDQLGLDPTSTNLTVANRVPVVTSVETIPLILTVPSGQPEPEGGWPVVIYGHGLQSNRTAMLGLADTLAAAGQVAVAIDFPLHGVVDEGNPFNIGNTPFAGLGRERTFGVDYIDNETLEPIPDGEPDPSGLHALNFRDWRMWRDNIRQGVIDLSTVTASLQNFDLDGDGTGDLRPFNAGYAGISWGGINGTVFAGLEPLLNKAFLSVPGAGCARSLEASETFGPLVRGGLAAVGIEPGDPLFELYLTLGTTVCDPGDPINWISRATAAKPVLVHEVIGDSVIPNFVPGAPLSGTEQLIRVGGFEAFDSTQTNPEGLRSAARFVPPATHSSLQDPRGSLEATIEMQTQMASFFAFEGSLIQVGNPDVMVPVVDMQAIIGAPAENRTDKPGKSKGKRAIVGNPDDPVLDGGPFIFKRSVE